MQVDESFDQSVKYYIRKEGVYYTVRSKGSVLKVLKSRKKSWPGISSGESWISSTLPRKPS